MDSVTTQIRISSSRRLRSSMMLTAIINWIFITNSQRSNTSVESLIDSTAVKHIHITNATHTTLIDVSGRLWRFGLKINAKHSDDGRDLGKAELAGETVGEPVRIHQAQPSPQVGSDSRIPEDAKQQHAR